MKRLLPFFAAFASLLPFQFQFAAAQTAPPASRDGGVSGAAVDAAAAPRSGSITGRVVGDDGQPLANIRVSVVAFDANSANQSVQAALTDGEGNFRANGLRVGAYQVSAYAPAYVTPRSPGIEANYYRIGDTVTLTLRKGGVITGRVTDASGEPVAGAAVLATQVRDEAGRKPTRMVFQREDRTDDRGVYRIYGLDPGGYVVAVGGGRYTNPGSQNPAEGDVPTYHPSSTRDDAGEVDVVVGAEVSGVNITHRGERGHVISGSVAGVNSDGAQTPAVGMVETVNINLARMPGGAVVGSTFVVVRESRRGFSFRGLPDGEYELVARLGFPGKDGSVSAPRRVTVRGGDVTGVELVLAPLGSVAGRFALEPRAASGQKGKCAARDSALAEIVVAARRDEPGRKSPDEDEQSWWSPPSRGGNVGDDGEFVLRNLDAGHYRLVPHLPSEGWYVRSVTAATGGAARDAGRSGLTLKPGEKVTGLKVTLAEGAASLKGKVVAAEGARLPARLRVHLIPAGREAADDVLHYAEVQANRGAFAFVNLAPGRYLLLARALSEDEVETSSRQRPVAWDAEARARLRREAEAANVAVELTTCQRVSDFALKFTGGK
jgi:hypothetical protein